MYPTSLIETEIAILLAGRCAEARARRPDPDGWCRKPDVFSSVCHHEAGHVVMSVALGRGQCGLAAEQIVTATSIRTRGIAARSTAPPPPDAPDISPTFERFEAIKSDFRRATELGQFAVTLTGESWLKYLREMWIAVDHILDRHWLALKLLAEEVKQEKVVSRDRAQEILDRWMDVREHSISQYLRNQQTNIAA